MSTQSSVLVGVIVEALIDTTFIWGRCPWPCRRFPHGFEFMFYSLKARRLEQCEVPEDNGLTLHAVNDDTPWVIVQDEVESGRHRIDVADARGVLGVSIFKLLELLYDQKERELDDALNAQVVARDYEAVTMTIRDGKYHEQRERIQP